MESRIHIITLGVEDLSAAIHFYRNGLRWTLSSVSGGDFALFKIAVGTALALFPRHLLALDAGVEDKGGFGGITLAQNVPSKKQVDEALAQAVRAGGMLLRAAGDTEWGGYSGYFADPDGHPWEVAWNPHFELLDGRLVLPD